MCVYLFLLVEYIKYLTVQQSLIFQGFRAAVVKK